MTKTAKLRRVSVLLTPVEMEDLRESAIRYLKGWEDFSPEFRRQFRARRSVARKWLRALPAVKARKER